MAFFSRAHLRSSQPEYFTEPACRERRVKYRFAPLQTILTGRKEYHGRWSDQGIAQALWMKETCSLWKKRICSRIWLWYGFLWLRWSALLLICMFRGRCLDQKILDTVIKLTPGCVLSICAAEANARESMKRLLRSTPFPERKMGCFW